MREPAAADPLNSHMYAHHPCTGNDPTGPCNTRLTRDIYHIQTQRCFRVYGFLFKDIQALSYNPIYLPNNWPGRRRHSLADGYRSTPLSQAALHAAFMPLLDLIS